MHQLKYYYCKLLCSLPVIITLLIPSNRSFAIEANPLNSKIGTILARSDMVVIADIIEKSIIPIDHINYFKKNIKITLPDPTSHKNLYGLRVLHVLALSNNLESGTHKVTEKGEAFRVQVIEPMLLTLESPFMFKDRRYLLFLKRLDNVTDDIKSYNPATLENLEIVDGKRSFFEYGEAYEYQRMIQRTSFHTESMQDLTEATAALCDLMKNGADTKSLLEKLNADKRYIFKYAAEQYKQIDEDKRARFVYTNSKLPVLPPNGPVRGVPLLPKKAN